MTPHHIYSQEISMIGNLKETNEHIKADQINLSSYVKSIDKDQPLTYSREKLKLNFKGRTSLASNLSNEYQLQDEEQIAARG